MRLLRYDFSDEEYEADGGSSGIEGQGLKRRVRGPGVRRLFQPGDELVKSWKRE
jgi:hypothetical protein